MRQIATRDYRQADSTLSLHRHVKVWSGDQREGIELFSIPDIYGELFYM